MNSKPFGQQPVRITGQHFTRSSSLIRQMIDQAGIGKNDLVLDIGAGNGALTKPLSEKAGRVIAIERDSRLVTRLRASCKTISNVKILGQDFRAIYLPNQPFKVVSNIPYSITTDIFGRLMDKPGAFTGGTLIIELGAAKRFTRQSLPDPRITGWNTWFDISFVRIVPSHSFTPPPKVSSAMVQIKKRKHPSVNPKDMYCYMAFMAYSLSRPNLCVAGVLRSVFSRTQVNRILADTGLNQYEPIRNLSIDQWAHCFYTMQRLIPARLHPGMPGKYKKLYT